MQGGCCHLGLYLTAGSRDDRSSVRSYLVSEQPFGVQKWGQNCSRHVSVSFLVFIDLNQGVSH